MPEKMEYMPMIVYYIIYSLLHSFFSFIWFAILNSFREQQRLPQWLTRIARYIALHFDRNSNKVEPVLGLESKPDEVEVKTETNEMRDPVELTPVQNFYDLDRISTVIDVSDLGNSSNKESKVETKNIEKLVDAAKKPPIAEFESDIDALNYTLIFFSCILIICFQIYFFVSCVLDFI